MKTRQLRLRRSLGSALAVAPLILCSLAAVRTARAADPLGLYIGGAYGEAHIRVRLNDLTVSGTYPLGELDGTHSAYQAMLGIQPLSFLGAEITYMDFGTLSSRTVPFAQAGAILVAAPAYPSEVQASQKGEAAYVLLHLPIPVIDLYVKAGLSRITTDSRVTYVGPLPCVGTECTSLLGDINVSRDITETAFAYGAGLQWKLGDWAVRAEYERFSAAGENPTLASIGMLYWLP